MRYYLRYMTLISFAFLSFEELSYASGWSEKQDLESMKNNNSPSSRSVFSVGKRQEMTEDERRRESEIAKKRLADSIRWLRNNEQALERYDTTNSPPSQKSVNAIQRQNHMFNANRTLIVSE
jgi:hypothetical protein